MARDNSSALTDLRGLLKHAGLRVTLPRMQILRILMEQNSHLSIDDVHTALARYQIELPRASLYNAVHKFVQAGLVQPFAVHGRILYEMATAPHAHFVCRRCGAVRNVYGVAIPSSPGPADLTGYRIEETQIILRGLCPACDEQDDDML